MSVFAVTVTIIALLALAGVIICLRPMQKRRSRVRSSRRSMTFSQRAASWILPVPHHEVPAEEMPSFFPALYTVCTSYFHGSYEWIKRKLRYNVRLSKSPTNSKGGTTNHTANTHPHTNTTQLTQKSSHVTTNTPHSSASLARGAGSAGSHTFVATSQGATLASSTAKSSVITSSTPASTTSTSSNVSVTTLPTNPSTSILHKKNSNPNVKAVHSHQGPPSSSEPTSYVASATASSSTISVSQKPPSPVITHNTFILPSSGQVRGNASALSSASTTGSTSSTGPVLNPSLVKKNLSASSHPTNNTNVNGSATMVNLPIKESKPKNKVDNATAPPSSGSISKTTHPSTASTSAPLPLVKDKNINNNMYNSIDSNNNNIINRPNHGRQSYLEMLAPVGGGSNDSGRTEVEETESAGGVLATVAELQNDIELVSKAVIEDVEPTIDMIQRDAVRDDDECGKTEGDESEDNHYEGDRNPLPERLASALDRDKNPSRVNPSDLFSLGGMELFPEPGMASYLNQNYSLSESTVYTKRFGEESPVRASLFPSNPNAQPASYVPGRNFSISLPATNSNSINTVIADDSNDVFATTGTSGSRWTPFSPPSFLSSVQALPPQLDNRTDILSDGVPLPLGADAMAADWLGFNLPYLSTSKDTHTNLNLNAFSGSNQLPSSLPTANRERTGSFQSHYLPATTSSPVIHSVHSPATPEFAVSDQGMEFWTSPIGEGSWNGALGLDQNWIDGVVGQTMVDDREGKATLSFTLMCLALPAEDTVSVLVSVTYYV